MTTLSAERPKNTSEKTPLHYGCRSNAFFILHKSNTNLSRQSLKILNDYLLSWNKPGDVGVFYNMCAKTDFSKRIIYGHRDKQNLFL